MINILEVIDFFDRRAVDWDREMIRDSAVIGAILDETGVGPGDRVLDVACGTGVLIPDYLSRRVRAIDAVDVSPEMIRLAREHRYEGNVRFLCADAELLAFDGLYDRIVIYNAFPHFPHPEVLLRHLGRYLKPGGTLTVAHGMSREALKMHHQGSAEAISRELPEAAELAAMPHPGLTVTAAISDAQHYQVVWKKQ